MNIKLPLQNFKLEILVREDSTHKHNIYASLTHTQLPIVFAIKYVIPNNSSVNIADAVEKLYNEFVLCMKYGKAQTVVNMTSFIGDDMNVYMPEYDIEKESWFILKDNERIYETFE